MADEDVYVADAKLQALVAELEHRLLAVGAKEPTLEMDAALREMQTMSGVDSENIVGRIDYIGRLTRKLGDIAMNGAPEPNLALRAVSVVSNAFDSQDEDAKGLTAMKQPRFVVRAAQWLFLVLSFALMSEVDHINDDDVKATDLYDDKNCEVDITSSFDFAFSPYRYVIAVAVMAWIYCTILLFLFTVPIPENIPGTAPVRAFCLANDKLLSLFMDAGFLFLAFIACLAAAVEMEQVYTQSTKIVASNGDTVAVPLAWTLKTWVLTGTHNDCIKDNPIPRIRGSIACLFMFLFLLAFSCQFSYRAWRESKSTDPQALEDAAAAAADANAVAGPQAAAAQPPPPPAGDQDV